MTTGNGVRQRTFGMTPRTWPIALALLFGALLVWYFILLAMGRIPASPLDLMDWFLSIPWTDHIRSLVNQFTV